MREDALGLNKWKISVIQSSEDMRNKIFFFTIIFIYSIHVGAQNWYSFAYKMPIAKYAGLQVKLEATVKIEAMDEEASARLWLRIDKNGKRGFFDNMWNSPIKKNDWERYSIEGKIDDDATDIVFGTLNHYSGSFYYDDFIISIKNRAGNWEVIYQTNFENGFDLWKDGIFIGESGTNKLFNSSIYNTNVKDHQKCLKIVGANVPNYGHNKAVGKYAKVNGINLYYEICGSGKPLVILHGNGGSIAAASPHLEFFSEKYQVIAIDSRGQGKSIDDISNLTYDLMASDVNQLLEQLHIDSAYIWGHSDGAILSLILAMDYPKKVKKVIAYAANIATDTVGMVLAEFENVKKKALFSESPKEKQLNMMMYKYPNIPFSDLHKIKADVLVMSGDNDVIPLEHTLNIYKNIERSNLCVMPGAAHGGAWGKPKLFQQLVVEFFEKPFVK